MPCNWPHMVLGQQERRRWSERIGLASDAKPQGRGRNEIIWTEGTETNDWKKWSNEEMRWEHSCRNTQLFCWSSISHPAVIKWRCVVLRQLKYQRGESRKRRTKKPFSSTNQKHIYLYCGLTLRLISNVITCINKKRPTHLNGTILQSKERGRALKCFCWHRKLCCSTYI